MLKLVRTCFIVGICVAFASTFSHAAGKFTLSTMPRVDTHCHADNLAKMRGHMEVRRILKEQYGKNLEVWIDLGAPWGGKWSDWGGPTSPWEPVKQRMEFLKKANEEFQSRFLPCLHDWCILDGPEFTPAEIAEWKNRGLVGFKILAKDQSGIDAEAWEPVFAKMEEIGMVGASIHCADPYPKVIKDPVTFWSRQNEWRRVLDRHPKLVVVNAHMLNLFSSDDQLGYLSYLLETYPNLNVDLSATFRSFHKMDREELKTFFAAYSDRILLGFDLGSRVRAGNYQWVADRHQMSFQLLESDNIIKYKPYQEPEVEMRGLALPLEVLKKIYYENACRIYPRVKEVLQDLGYTLE